MKKMIFTISLLIGSSIFLMAGQRPDINSFSSTQRTQLRNLMMDYISTSVVQEHQNSMMLAHNYQMEFLTWHRDYIGDMENYLRNNGGSQFVPLPRWNPSTNIPNEFRGSIAGLTGSNIDFSPSGFNFSRFFNNNTLCNYSAGNNNYCGASSTVYNPTAIDAFAKDLQCEHNAVHNSVGGIMTTSSSPQAAIFWLYHAYIDDIYYDYDASCNCNNQELWTWDNSPYYGTGYMFPGMWPFNSADPGNSVYTSAYGWIFVPAGQNACGAGLYFYGTICGITGWFFDYNYGDGFIYSYSQGGWLQCAGKTDVLAEKPINDIEMEELLAAFDEQVAPDEDEYEVFKSLTIPGFENELEVGSLDINAYPNPLNDYTTISYELPKESNVLIAVFSLDGQQIAEIVNGENQLEGQYQIRFDASSLTSGMYYVQIDTGYETKIQKLVVAK